MLSSRDGAAAVGPESLAGRGWCGPDLRGTKVLVGAEAGSASIVVATTGAEASFVAATALPAPVVALAVVPAFAPLTAPLVPGVATTGPGGAVGAASEAAAGADAAAAFDAAPGIGKAVKPAATEAGCVISTAVGAAPITGADDSVVADAAAATAAAAAPGFCRSTR